MINNRFTEVFGNKPVIAMLHLAGGDPVERALEELAIFEEEGVDGALVENYHGSVADVKQVLDATSKRRWNLEIGVNILANEFDRSLPLAGQYGLNFIQLDNIAGRYTGGELDHPGYVAFKQRNPNVIVMGGVHPKYYIPVPDSDLEQDVKTGMERAEVIVVTGKGTGSETPLDKIMEFREIVGNHPLIIGAGLTPENVYEQLCIADGGIVGSCFKPDGNTEAPVERERVRAFMDVVRSVRA